MEVELVASPSNTIKEMRGRVYLFELAAKSSRVADHHGTDVETRVLPFP